MEDEASARKVLGNKLGESEGVTLEVTGMLQANNGERYFQVKSKATGKVMTMNREDIISKDPIALVVFYESKIQIK